MEDRVGFVNWHFHLAFMRPDQCDPTVTQVGVTHIQKVINYNVNDVKCLDLHSMTYCRTIIFSGHATKRFNVSLVIS